MGNMSAHAPLGHNIGRTTIEVEVRLFNSVTRFRDGPGDRMTLDVPAGTTVGELAERLGIPTSALFLVLINGRDITPGLIGAGVRAGREIEHGDVVAFSGAVPYSYGYGSPVV
jgi:hypothetical protein